MTTAITYADAEVAQRLAQDVTRIRALGFTRPALYEASGLTSARLWRIEQGRAHADEVPLVEGLLAKISSGELVAPQRGRVDARQAKIDAALAAIDAVETGATKATLWQALGYVAATLRDDDDDWAERTNK